VSKSKKTCIFFGKDVHLFRKRCTSFLKRCKKKDAAPDHASFFCIFSGEKDAKKKCSKFRNILTWRQLRLEQVAVGPPQIVAIGGSYSDWLEIEKIEKWIISALEATTKTEVG
jgi:hypothetical protein